MQTAGGGKNKQNDRINFIQVILTDSIQCFSFLSLLILPVPIIGLKMLSIYQHLLYLQVVRNLIQCNALSKNEAQKSDNSKSIIICRPGVTSMKDIPLKILLPEGEGLTSSYSLKGNPY